MTDQELFAVRIALIQAFLQDNGYDGVLLSRSVNFAMATGGRRNHVWTFSDMGACSLFVTRAGETFYIGNNIELPRLMDEELGSLGCGARSFLWFEGDAADLCRKEFGGALVSDDGSLGKNVHGDLAYLRALLTPRELEKYRCLGARAADAMTAAVKAVEPGMTEWEVAALILSEGAKRACHVPVALVSADGRAAKYRHPIPTEAGLLGGGGEVRVRGYAMLVGCFLKEGLVVSLTRFRQCGDIPGAIPGLQAKICGVDALMQEASVPGRTLGDVFAAARKGYADLGFLADEWHNHHQGGTTGYAGRTCKAVPEEPWRILDERWSRRVKEIAGVDVAFGHAFAWNPSGPGVKSEDTFILAPDGTQTIVSDTPEFPRVDVEAVLGRPTAVMKSGFLSCARP